MAFNGAALASKILIEQILQQQVWLWLCFVVLKATGISTNDALEGGSSHSSEGFPFPKM
jgi:hypothetical protein